MITQAARGPVSGSGAPPAWAQRSGLGLVSRARGLLAVALLLGGFLGTGVALLGGEVARAEEQPRVSALADPGSRQKVRTDSQGRRITVVDFDDARIEGQVKAPDGFVLRSRDGVRAESILELRKNFHKRIRAAGHEGLQAVPMR